jgi:PLP dependent protein
MSIQLQTLNRLLVETKEKNVTLVAVSKTKSMEEIMEVYQTGHHIFGENYVQELIEKQQKLPKDIDWHFIGHLQTNKVKMIAPFVKLIHGVDSFNLLKEINKQGIKNNRVIPCLLQVFIAEEETKFGLSQEETIKILESTEFATLKHVAICGLMGMSTNTANQLQIKKEFENLASFFHALQKKYHQFSVLSMGMTSDYKLAIASGSNMIRIGSAIFGNR